MALIEFSKLNYSYLKDSLVIKNMSSEIAEGRIYTLLGLNGSGKTTLIKLIAGILKPLNGEIKLGDVNINEISVYDRSKEISYVSQDTNTGDDHYVSDYLSFGLMNKLSWYESPKESDLEKVKKAARTFKITRLLNKQMNQLSGGEKQIVMIARAYIQKTKIIILDEPTSALDIKNQSLILNILKELVKKEKKTIILSTHNPNHALYLNSEVILIHEGEIIDKGKAENIINTEKLKKVYGSTITYSKDLAYNEVSVV